METITHKITKKLKRKLVDEFLPIGEELRKEGQSDRYICGTFETYVKQKSRQFYKKERREKSQLGHVLADVIKNSDSKVEMIYYQILEKNKIDFKFQYRIGPYRTDFLINGYLVLEIDGPQHNQQKEYDQRRDRYIKRMGYEVLRIPLWLATASENGVIEAIKEALESR